MRLNSEVEVQKIQHALDGVFDKMLLNYQYARCAVFFEKYFRSYPFLRLNPKNLTHLGLLYDHVAMTKPKKKVSLEKKARHNYQIALKLNPKFYPAWWGLGRIFWHNNDRRSLPYAKKAYHLAKKEKDISVGQFAQNIALIYKKLGDNRKAEYWFKRGIKESPQEWGTHYNLMCFYFGTKPNSQEVRKLAKKIKIILKTKNRNSRWLKEVYALANKIAK